MTASRRIVIATIGILLTASIVHALEFERVLLPVAVPYEVSGAFGSRWVTQVTARNDNPDVVVITASPGGCLITVCPSDEVVGNKTIEPQVSPAFPHPGAFIYVSRPGNGNVTFNLRIQDVSRNALSWGTEIPVVREADLYTAMLSLLGVPADARFRSALRVYDFDGASDNQIHVTLADLETNEILAETFLTLTSPSGLHDIAIPGFAQISSLMDTFPQIAGHRIRVAITPMSAGLRFWAFVSVTNDETQEVTTITPQ